jgi:hypothetical protein
MSKKEKYIKTFYYHLTHIIRKEAMKEYFLGGGYLDVAKNRGFNYME